MVCFPVIFSAENLAGSLIVPPNRGWFQKNALTGHRSADNWRL